MRKVVGYAGTVDPYPNEAHPKNDGVFAIDLQTNKTKLIVSIAEVFDFAVKDYPVLADRHIWFNHTDICPSGKKFLFLARSRNENNKIDSAMFTANMDGSDLKMMIPFGSSVSHFGWRNDDEIAATLEDPSDKKTKHFLFSLHKKESSIIGENFIVDAGHCTFSPNGRGMATDRTEDGSRSTSLWLYDMELDKGVMLANLAVPEYKYLHSNTRCDFHPRWNPSGNKICFDAIDTATNTRQMHVVELL
jgi:Tol biopolymer transport system component